jgi:hypothetical protein
VLTELYGKGGGLCQMAKNGQLHCPLIVRPTSEDVITGQLVQALRVLNPRWWLSDLLNNALGGRRFRRQAYRNLRIDPWVNKPPYPRELLPWAEGSTQVDICISYENPPTTVYIEAKYGSGISATTANGDGTHGYPADQITRNLRVGLLDCGWFDGPGSLFDMKPRAFAFILFSPGKAHPLIECYRHPDRVREAIPHADLLTGLPGSPFVGQLSYSDVGRVLGDNRRFLTRPERRIAEDLSAYLEFKQAHTPSRTTAEPSRADNGQGS